MQQEQAPRYGSLRDLAAIGFDAEWVVVRASDIRRHEDTFGAPAPHPVELSFPKRREPRASNIVKTRDGYRFDRGNEPIDWTTNTPHAWDTSVLSDEFVQWMQMFPSGWVTDHLTRNQALRALGNAVVTPQAEYALTILNGRD